MTVAVESVRFNPSCGARDRPDTNVNSDSVQITCRCRLMPTLDRVVKRSHGVTADALERLSAVMLQLSLIRRRHVRRHVNFFQLIHWIGLPLHSCPSVIDLCNQPTPYAIN